MYIKTDVDFLIQLTVQVSARRSWWENYKYIRMLILIKGGIKESEDYKV